MTDQQQQPPAPTTPGYPGFTMTDGGLEALYREFGRMTHQAFEAELKTARMTTLLQQVQAQLAPQAEPAVPSQPDEPTQTARPTPITAKAGG